MRARLSGSLVATILALALAGCGLPDVGEACSGSPQLGGCVEGAYCVLDDAEGARGSDDDPSWSSFTCRAACTRQADCESGFLCEPVPTTPSLSACRPIHP